MENDTAVAEDASTDESDGGAAFTRREALALLGSGTAAGAANVPSATGATAGANSPVEWEKDRDARGHDLVDVATVGANAVTAEELGGDPSGEFGSVTVDNADLDHVHAGAREADRIVWKDESGTFHADGPDGTVASGDDLIEVAQAAVDSLTEGRDWKETVLIASPGTVGPRDEIHAIDLPSYTVLDVPATITVEDEGDPLVIPVRATDVSHVAVPRLRVTGNPRFSLLFSSCSEMYLGRMEVSVSTYGVRVDNSGDSGRSADLRLDSAYIENANNHTVETFGLDRCQIGEVVARNHTGCAVIVNETKDATIGSVVGQNARSQSSYATFRAANYCENVTVGQVVSRNAPRGVHLITADDVTIGEVDIVGSRDRGIKIDRIVDNVTIQGGRVANTTPTAVVVQGASVSINDLRVVDDRPEHKRTQEYGIHVTHTARNCRIVGNDVRRAGTEADIRVDATADDVRPNTTVRDNVGDGVASGSVVLSSGESPAARVEGVSGKKDTTLDLRANAVRGPDDGKAFAWESYFEWNGEAARWDLCFEWRTDPLENVEVEYVVDRPLANLGRVSGEVDSP